MYSVSTLTWSVLPLPCVIKCIPEKVECISFCNMHLNIIGV